MLLWGGLHGVYLVGERVIGLLRPRAPGRERSRWRHAAAIAVVFTLGSLAFVPFRLDTQTALIYWRRLAGPPGGVPDLRIIFLMLWSLWLDRIEGRHGDATAFWPWPRLARASLLAIAVVLWVLLTRQQSPAPFIYRGF